MILSVLHGQITDMQQWYYNMCNSLCCILVAHLKSSIWMVNVDSQHNAARFVFTSWL